MAAHLPRKAVSTCRAAVDQREVGQAAPVPREGQGAEMGGGPPVLNFFRCLCFFTTWAGSWQQSEQGGCRGRFLKTGLAVPVLSCPSYLPDLL